MVLALPKAIKQVNYNNRHVSVHTFENGVGFENLLFDPGMLAGNGSKVLENELG